MKASLSISGADPVGLDTLNERKGPLGQGSAEVESKPKKGCVGVEGFEPECKES